MEKLNNGEDKYIKFTLHKKWENFDVRKTYMTDDIVWYANAYWSFVGASPIQGEFPSASSANWSVESALPKYPTTNITGMVIFLTFAGSRNVVEKYSLNASAGYQSVDGTDSANSVYQIKLPRTKTQNLKEGLIVAEIKIKEYSGANAEYTTISNIPVIETNTPITEFTDVP